MIITNLQGTIRPSCGRQAIVLKADDALA